MFSSAALDIASGTKMPRDWNNALLYLLKSGCQWRMLPEGFPNRVTVYAYFAKWSKPDQDGTSALERALKKIRWRGPQETGSQRHDQLLDR